MQSQGAQTEPPPSNCFAANTGPAQIHEAYCVQYQAFLMKEREREEENERDKDTPRGEEVRERGGLHREIN